MRFTSLQLFLLPLASALPTIRPAEQTAAIEHRETEESKTTGYTTATAQSTPYKRHATHEKVDITATVEPQPYKYHPFMTYTQPPIEVRSAEDEPTTDLASTRRKLSPVKRMVEVVKRRVETNKFCPF